MRASTAGPGRHRFKVEQHEKYIYLLFSSTFFFHSCCSSSLRFQMNDYDSALGTGGRVDLRHHVRSYPVHRESIWEENWCAGILFKCKFPHNLSRATRQEFREVSVKFVVGLTTHCVRRFLSVGIFLHYSAWTWLDNQFVCSPTGHRSLFHFKHSFTFKKQSALFSVFVRSSTSALVEWH